VSRCPDRSVIEQYNYKGSEKDEDGFYFKGNTSVPSYHRTEELQEPSESWDNHDGQTNLQQSIQNNTERFVYHQTSPQSTPIVTDTLSLSPEERESYRRQLRREAASRSSNPGMQLPSRMCATSQGYNTNLENVHGQQYSPSSNPVFRHCVQQGAISSSSQQQGRYDSNFSQVDSVGYGVSRPKNPIFQYCIEKMQGEAPQTHSSSPVCQTSSEQYITQVSHGDRNLVTPCVSSNSYTNDFPPSPPTDTNPRFKTSGFSVTEMENKLKLAENVKPDVAAVSNVCGQPTSPTSKGVNAPHLAGVGRARLHAEARKNNFGGICFSTTRATGNETTRTPTAGRGRGILNVMYSS